jgi:hypothetical protein
MGAWYRVVTDASGEPSDYTWTMDTNPEESTLAIIPLTNASNSNPINISDVAFTTAGAALNSPSVITTVDGCLILSLFGKDDGQDTVTKPSALAEEWNLTGGASSAGCQGAGAQETQVSQGATGTYQWTHDGADEELIAFTIAIEPTGVLIETGGGIRASVGAGEDAAEMARTGIAGAPFVALGGDAFEAVEMSTSVSPLAAMGSGFRALVIRPDTDQSIGQWSDEGDGVVNIYLSIDEEIANDADYIKSELDPSGSVYEAALSDVTDPGRHDNHILPYRFRRQPASATGLDLTVRLMQGAAEIASWSHNSIGSEWVTAQQTLTSEQAAAISDYSDLRIRLEADQP